MASFVFPIEGGARLAVRSLKLYRNVRTLHQSMRLQGAHSFSMPAMSPTMTEGNITAWKVKEGQAYSAGDVLLEIETDKAQMDVEAQDDGILARILQGDGSKSVKVGTRIAVCAESGDDLESLEMPADESTPIAQEASKPLLPEASPPKQPSSSQTQLPSKATTEASPDGPSRGSRHNSQGPSGKEQKRGYPLYPSVVQLLHINGLDLAEAAKIPTTGPNGRLLKGDVLAYLGTIDASYPRVQSNRIEKLSHLDLSNINRTTARQPSVDPVAPLVKEAVSTPSTTPDAKLIVSISLKQVRDVQQRIHSTLGIDIPLETFISRAVDISNTGLPRQNTLPTADDLFNQILGLNKVSVSSPRGHFNPQILALPPNTSVPKSISSANVDIIDTLIGSSRPRSMGLPSALPTATAGHSSLNVFSLTVPKGEEERAKIFLERVKTILQVDPGRLIL